MNVLPLVMLNANEPAATQAVDGGPMADAPLFTLALNEKLSMGEPSLHPALTGQALDLQEDYAAADVIIGSLPADSLPTPPDTLNTLPADVMHTMQMLHHPASTVSAVTPAPATVTESAASPLTPTADEIPANRLNDARGIDNVSMMSASQSTAAVTDTVESAKTSALWVPSRPEDKHNRDKTNQTTSQPHKEVDAHRTRSSTASPSVTPPSDEARSVVPAATPSAVSHAVASTPFIPAAKPDAAPAPLQTPTVAPPATLEMSVGSTSWQNMLNQHITYFTRSGIHNAELRLHPEELGTLRVNLRLNSDVANIHFMSDNQQVRAMLESAMPGLRHSLAESGIQLEQGSIGSDESAGHLFENTSEQQGNGHEQEHLSAGQNIINEEEKMPRKIVTVDGGISLFA